MRKQKSKLEKFAEIKKDPGVVIPLVRKRLLARQQLPNTHPRDRIYPSEICKDDWCIRATYYRIKGYPEPPQNESFNLTNIFAEGNAIHDKWQDWLTDDLWGDWRCVNCGSPYNHCVRPAYCFCLDTFDPRQGFEYREVPLTDDDLLLKGRADGALYPDTLIEFKSAGIGSFRREAPKLTEQNTYTVNGKQIVDVDGLWKNFRTPLLTHVKQVNVYFHMAKRMGLPFKNAAVVYEFKASQATKEFLIYPSEDLVAPMLDKAQVVVKALRDNVPPTCPKGEKGCKECRTYEENA